MITERCSTTFVDDVKLEVISRVKHLLVTDEQWRLADRYASYLNEDRSNYVIEFDSVVLDAIGVDDGVAAQVLLAKKLDEDFDFALKGGRVYMTLAAFQDLCTLADTHQGRSSRRLLQQLEAAFKTYLAERLSKDREHYQVLSKLQSVLERTVERMRAVVAQAKRVVD